jgi:hypothetical protein
MLSKIANPFYYPVSVLIGGLALVLGIRWLGMPNLVILPSSVALTVLSATGLKARELDPKEILKRQLTQQLEEVRHLSEQLGQKTETLRQEANQKLSQNQFELDLLIAVQEICDFNQEIPKIIAEIEQKFSKNESVLSIEQLNHQLLEVNKKVTSSSGSVRKQLEQLAVSLERNLNLAKTGEDTRQAQIFNLHRIIQDAAGSLQQLQNQLRTANLSKTEDIQTLKFLTEEIKNQQEQFAILVNDLM